MEVFSARGTFELQGEVSVGIGPSLEEQIEDEIPGAKFFETDYHTQLPRLYGTLSHVAFWRRKHNSRSGLRNAPTQNLPLLAIHKVSLIPLPTKKS